MMLDPTIRELAGAIFRTSPSDRAFFRRRRDRSYRVRRASIEEADALLLVTGLRPTPTSRVFAAVHRTRRETVTSYFVAPAAAETDLSDRAAGTVFRWLVDQASEADAMGAMGCEGVR